MSVAGGSGCGEPSAVPCIQRHLPPDPPLLVLGPLLRSTSHPQKPRLNKTHPSASDHKYQPANLLFSGPPPPTHTHLRHGGVCESGIRCSWPTHTNKGSRSPQYPARGRFFTQARRCFPLQAPPLGLGAVSSPAGLVTGHLGIPCPVEFCRERSTDRGTRATRRGLNPTPRTSISCPAHGVEHTPPPPCLSYGFV